MLTYKKQKIFFSSILALGLAVFLILSAHAAYAEGRTDRILLIAIDGLRGDVVNATTTPTLYQLAKEGAATVKAQTVFPSRTLPALTSLVSGVDPQTHGVKQNNILGLLSFTGETVFGLVKDGHYKTAAIVSKREISGLTVPSILDYAQYPTKQQYWPSDRVVQEFRTLLAGKDINLSFVHINEPDLAGHAYGWMTKKYKQAVKKADQAVGKIVKSASQKFGKDSYVLFITADHGGHGKTHGTRDPQDMTIPWIVWGKNVRENARLSTPISILDTAPTILWLFGLDAPSFWQGRVVREAFQ